MDTSSLLFVIIASVVYAVFAIRWGLRYVDGRWAALEEPKKKPLKIVVSILLGLVLGAFKICWMIIKLVIWAGLKLGRLMTGQDSF